MYNSKILISYYLDVLCNVSIDIICILFVVISNKQ